MIATANLIRAEQNPWIAFERLESPDALGRSFFRDTIGELLIPAQSIALPDIYRTIWNISNISGVITLNLDRLVARGFYEARPSDVPSLNEFHSRTVGNYVRMLGRSQPFIYNAHGIGVERDSWILTYKSLASLLQDDAYKLFMNIAFTTHSIVFLGLSADDVAAGGHIERLRESEIELDSHYWITSRDDLATDKWAESTGIRVIRYQNLDRTHSELYEAVEGLVSPAPVSEPESYAPTINISLDRLSSVGETPQSLSHEYLEGLSTSDLRSVLNREAIKILELDNTESFSEFQDFTEEYDQEIHRSWYVSTKMGRNDLLGYSIISKADAGSFGQVYKAIDESGQEVAIKLLRQEIGENPELLMCFRRGVRAMRLLSDQGVKGMVEYKESSEIPAFVVMDWIEGANLRQAVMAEKMSQWEDILRLASDLSGIIRDAHLAPQMVLHRDLRPENVMLEGFWDSYDWRVVVLDFDLSWHKGAYEGTVMHGSGTGGYWAPEQVERIVGVSTQHASVDSFGFGMLLYFVASGRDPVPNNHLHHDWNELVYQSAERRKTIDLKCLPNRFARLIVSATSHRQSERWDIGQIHGEISRIQRAHRSLDGFYDEDIWAEEIAARSSVIGRYSWNEDTFAAEFESPSGLHVSISGIPGKHQVAISLSKTQMGHEKYKRGTEHRVIVDRAADQLSHGGWRGINKHTGLQQGRALNASYPIQHASVDHLRNLVTAMDNAMKELQS
jgi:hypothetical protein